MSVLYSQVVLNNYNPVFSLATISSINVNTIKVSTVNAQVGSISSLNTSSIYANYAQISSGFISSISTTNITLDGNTLDTGGGGFGATLLLNGIPIATTANISSLAEWAYYPAISTIDCDQKDIVDCKDIFATNLNASNSITGVIGGFTTLNSGNITNTSNILTNTLQTTGLLQAASISTPSLRANLISTGTFNVSTLLGANAAIGGVSTNNISTANVTTAIIAANSGFYSTLAVSTITAGSVVFPITPNLVVSTITVNGATTTQTINVTNGGTFTGTRPNFNTGFVTSAANNFNNTNLDNCGQINAGALNLLGSATVGITANAGGSILTNNSINLATSNGGSSVINIEAKRNALAAYPIPLSQVNITAEGNCPNLPVVPLTPYGGAVNITAYQGPDPIFPLTALTNAFAPGAIHLTAYSKLLFPGLITESAGSILAYSGLTNPTAGLYGCSFYSALTCLSLTAGLSPALTSFPGTVYLRGDNGTKVLNGLYIDHLYPAAGYTLAISGAGGSNVTIDDCSYIGMTTNPVLDGGNVNGQIRNFSTISALKLLAPTLNVSTISTATVTVDQIYTRNININPPSTIYTVPPNLTINANITTDELDDPQYNNLNLYASSNINIQSFGTSGGGGNINIQCANNPALYSINITGDTYVSRTLTANLGMSTTNINLSTINGAAYVPGGGGVSVSSFTNLFATNASTTNLFVSSINGAAYPPSGGGSSWVSTATTQLNMNSNDINNVKNIDFLSGNIATGSNFLDINGAGLGTFTSLKSGDTYYTIDTAGNPTVNALSTNQVTISQTAGSDFVLFNNGDTRMNAKRDAYVEAVANIQTAALSTINTVPHTVFTGDIRAAGANLTGTLNMNGYVITDTTSTLTISSIGVNVGGAEVVALAAGDLSTNYASIALYSTSVFIAQVGDTTGVIDINAAGDIQTAAISTINTVQNTYFSGGVSRRLDGVGVVQPIIQYGQVSSSGGSGAVIVSTPQAYSAVNTYLPFACMADAPAAELYVSTLTEQAFEIGWQNGGGGNQLFNWHTMGT
jgi:hypothetical protein